MLYDELIRIEKMIEGNEYISGGAVGEIFRIIEKGKERVLIDFYIAD